jgi:hypothetical protein
MAKSFEDVRAETRKVLEELSPDDSVYVESWMKSFDQQHERKATKAPKPQKRFAVLPKPALNRIK